MIDEPELLLLERTRALLTPGTWTKGANARDKHGMSVSPRSEHATCFCLIGAITKVATERVHEVKKLVPVDCWQEVADQYAERSGNLYAYLEDIGKLHPVDFNDDPETTFPDIENLLDSAIDTARNELANG